MKCDICKRRFKMGKVREIVNGFVMCGKCEREFFLEKVRGDKKEGKRCPHIRA